jgi:hypothetical protein
MCKAMLWFALVVYVYNFVTSHPQRQYQHTGYEEWNRRDINEKSFITLICLNTSRNSWDKFETWLLLERFISGNQGRDSTFKSARTLRATSFVSAIGKIIKIIYLFIYGLLNYAAIMQTI